MVAALIGTEGVVAQTASGSVISSVETSTKALAMLAAALPARVSTPIATAGAGILTAAALIGGRVVRSGAPSAFTDTIDTAAAIIAALGTEAPVNTSWPVYVRNTTPFVETIAVGVGITLTGETVIPPNATGIFQVTVSSTAAVTVDGVGVITTDFTPPQANAALTTVGNGTLLAAPIVGGVLTRSGSTAAFTDTTDSAANIILALPNSQVGQSWELSIVNTTAFPETLAAGAGVTLTGLASPIPANSTGKFLCTYTAGAAVSMQMVSVAFNAAGGADPATTATFFGSGVGTFLEEGTLGKSISQAGINPGGTAGDYVVAVFTIKANSLDGVGNRGVQVVAKGGLASNANGKRIKVIAGATTAVVGSLVTGGTTIEDTGAQTTSGGGWGISVDIWKTGAANSNTQKATSNGKWMGATHLGAQAPVALTMTENADILVAITANAATAATDISLDTSYATAMN
jgi:hypothetical protein